jgi:Xaa-Pro dipeptidase
MYANPFSDKEIERRIGALRLLMEKHMLDAVIIASPENVFYLTGLDHWGYFVPHLLYVPHSGEPVLVTRAMEAVTIGNMVRSAEFSGHSDSETAADVMGGILNEKGMTNRKIGLEYDTSGLSFALGGVLTQRVASHWQDISGLVDSMRMVKSHEEQKLLRQAANVTDAATLAAIAAIRDGAGERDIAAQCYSAMIRAGGDPPGFGPFIRPQARLGEEHTTWGNGTVKSGETIFLELAGCVQRYHAPNGRLVHIGVIPDENAYMAEIAIAAFEAVIKALQPGARAHEVYAAWQNVVDDAGLGHYRRHHCGYVVGIGIAPSWTGGKSVIGLRHDSAMEIRSGLSFHILSWLMGTGKGDFFLSDTVLVGDEGPEVLTTVPAVNIV